MMPRAALLSLLLAAPALAADARPPADLPRCPSAEDQPDVVPLMKRTEQAMEGRSSIAVMSMKIVTPTWSRALKLKVWARGRDYALVQVLEAGPREVGMMTLKREKQLWNYLPQAGRVMKLPSGMLGDSWLGSDLTNDDLVKGSSLVDDFTSKVTGTEALDGRRAWHVVLLPKPSSTLVWDKIELLVDRETCVPLEESFFDEAGKVARKMQFSGLKQLGWRQVATKVTITPAEAGRQTQLVYDSQEFDVDIDESTFSLHRLQQGK